MFSLKKFPALLILCALAPAISADATAVVRRTIHYRAFLYLPVGASESTLRSELARIARSAVGPLRAEKIAPSLREPLDGIKVEQGPPEVFTVWDSNHPQDRSQQVQKVWFDFKDHVVASTDLRGKNTLPLTLLIGAPSNVDEAMLSTCSEDPFASPESFWYYFQPRSLACQAEIKNENDRIAATQSPPNTLSLAEASRSFETVSAELGREIPLTSSSYPEYQRLLDKQKLVIYLFTGVDLAPNFYNDRFLLEYFRALRELTRLYPAGTAQRLAAPGSLLDFNVRGKPISATSYEELFTWILDKKNLPAAVGSDATAIAELRQQARDQFAKHRVYWDFPFELNDRPFTVEIRSLYFDLADGKGTARLALREAFREGDVILYNGHSNLGAGDLDPSLYQPSDFSDRYQIFFFNSCSSFQHFSKSFLDLKPGGSRNLDIVSNASRSGIAGSGAVVASFVEGLVSLKSYRGLLESMHQAGCCEFDEMRVVEGDQDNSFDPQASSLVLRKVR